MTLPNSRLIILEVVSITLCNAVRTDSCIRPSLAGMNMVCAGRGIDVMPSLDVEYVYIRVDNERDDEVHLFHKLLRSDTISYLLPLSSFPHS